MRLHLIRHGETDSNLALALDTAHPGAPLNATGRAQAAALVDRFRDVPLTAVMTSDLTRAVETGAPLAAAHGLTPVTTADFREIQAGDLEMTSDEESFARFEAVVLPWFRGELDGAIPGGEDGRGTLARLDRAVAAVHALAGDGEAVLVGHGAAIRFWTVRRAAPAQPPGMLRNTGVIVLEGDPSAGWRVEEWEPVLV